MSSTHCRTCGGRSNHHRPNCSQSPHNAKPRGRPKLSQRMYLIYRADPGEPSDKLMGSVSTKQQALKLTKEWNAVELANAGISEPLKQLKQVSRVPLWFIVRRRDR
jgi:hypothetical protein